MRILLSGGAGFIGSHVVERLLDDGHEVVVLDRLDDLLYPPEIKEANLAPSLARPGCELVRGDVLDEALVERTLSSARFDALVHLAALAGVRPSVERPTDYYRVNVEGTVTLLQACARHGVDRVVAASSSSVYGNARRQPSREDDLAAADDPVSPYAASKRAMELACRAWFHLIGTPITCLRYFTVYGPRQRPEMAIHKFARRMLAGRTIELFGDGSSSRDYTYVADVVEGTLRALERAEGYAVYNLGNRRPTRLDDLVARLAAALGVEARVAYGPEQPGDVRATCADVSRAEASLGWTPQVPLDEGLRRFVAWLRE